jgi:hypothetical protein
VSTTYSTVGRVTLYIFKSVDFVNILIYRLYFFLAYFEFCKIFEILAAQSSSVLNFLSSELSLHMVIATICT